MMQRNLNSRAHNRPVVPIFGCRKRSREAAYADPIDLPTHLEDDDAFLTVQSQHMRVKQGNIGPVNPTFDISGQNRQNKALQNRGNRIGEFQQHQFAVLKTRAYGQNNGYGQQYIPSDQSYSIEGNHSHQVGSRYAQDDVSRQMSSLTKQPRLCNAPSTEGNRNISNRSLLQNQKGVFTKNPAKVGVKTIDTSSVRIITSTIKGMQKWKEAPGSFTTYFELIGTLDSTIAFNNPNPEKCFILKDQTGSIRCMFWEIDRRLSRISRQSTVRCIGRLTDGYIHCYSLRCAGNDELPVLRKLTESCERIFGKNMLLTREV